MSGDQNDWNVWSRHVLAELKRLNENYESLKLMNEDIKKDIAKFSGMEESISELRDWRSRIDEIASPAQLQSLVDKVGELEKFKIKAITVWVVIQTITTIAIGFAKNIF